MRHNILIPLAVVVAVPALAQDLPAFLASAQEKNVDQRLAREARVRAVADHGQTWGGLLPALTASGGYTRNEYEVKFEVPTGPSTTQTYTLNPQDQLDATLKAELPLIDASRWLRTAATAAGVEAAEDRARSSWDTVRRQVVGDYYALVSARAVLESARRSLQLAQAQLEQAQARATAGVANELEVVRSEAEVRRNEQLVADAESLAATSARALRTRTGLAPGATPPLPEDDLHPEAALEALERGVDGLPAVQAAEHDALQASRALWGAGLALVPTVTGQFSERFTNATSFLGKDRFWTAGVSFNWRLDVPAAYGLSGQRSAAATADLNAEKARDAARDQVHADWQKVKAAITKVRAAAAQVTAARRASALAHDRYRAGVATQTDVIQAERDLFSAEVSDIQARGELAQARASLKLSTGTPL